MIFARGAVWPFDLAPRTGCFSSSHFMAPLRSVASPWRMMSLRVPPPVPASLSKKTPFSRSTASEPRAPQRSTLPLERPQLGSPSSSRATGSIRARRSSSLRLEATAYLPPATSRCLAIITRQTGCADEGGLGAVDILFAREQQRVPGPTGDGSRPRHVLVLLAGRHPGEPFPGRRRHPDDRQIEGGGDALKNSPSATKGEGGDLGVRGSRGNEFCVDPFGPGMGDDLGEQRRVSGVPTVRF